MGRSTVMSAILIFFCVFVIPGAAYSQDLENEEAITLQITHVSEDDFLSDHGYFMLNQETTVYDEKGEKSDIRYIRLPCKANVTYKKINNNSFIALEVKVTEIIKTLDLPK